MNREFKTRFVVFNTLSNIKCINYQIIPAIAKLIVIMSILLLSGLLSAQEQNEPEIPVPGQVVHSKMDFSISGSSGMLVNSPNGNIFAGGLKLRVFVGKRFSFDTDCLFGRHFMQLGPGIVGIPAVLLGGNSFSGDSDEGQSLSELLIIGAFIILSVEHFSYHIPVAGFTDISPYISLLRFRQFENVSNSEEPDEVEGPACFAIGLEINKYFGKFIFSPYADYTTAYSGVARGFTFGINLGYYFSR